MFRFLTGIPELHRKGPASPKLVGLGRYVAQVPKIPSDISFPFAHGVGEILVLDPVRNAHATT